MDHWVKYIFRKQCVWVFQSCFSTGSYLFSSSCPLGALMFPNTLLGHASLVFFPIIYQPGGLPSLLKPKIFSRLSAPLLASEKAPNISILSRYEDSNFGVSVYNDALAMTRHSSCSCKNSLPNRNPFKK